MPFSRGNLPRRILETLRDWPMAELSPTTDQLATVAVRSNWLSGTSDVSTVAAYAA
jgi:hypothetical protein